MANAFRISAAKAAQLGLAYQDEVTKGVDVQRAAIMRLAKPNAEDLFADQLRFHVERGLKVARQLQFAKAAMGRRWAFDFSFHEYMVAVEIEGLIPIVMWRAKLDGALPQRTAGRVTNVLEVERQHVVLGRHASISGLKGDMEKYNAAAELGWLVLRFEQKDVKPRHAIDTTLRVLTTRGWRP